MLHQGRDNEDLLSTGGANASEVPKLEFGCADCCGGGWTVFGLRANGQSDSGRGRLDHTGLSFWFWIGRSHNAGVSPRRWIKWSDYTGLAIWRWSRCRRRDWPGSWWRLHATRRPGPIDP